MKGNKLRQIIAEVLKDHNAYFGDNTGSFDSYDYKINYQLSSALLLEYQRTYVLDIDIWSKDSIAVDVLSDEIEALFNYKTHQGASFYLDNRYGADEKTIYRRTLIYEVRTFEED
jgi:hypothetical protein